MRAPDGAELRTTVQGRLESVLEQASVSDDATAARRLVATILREWADEADRTPDAPFGGHALRWAADEMGRDHGR